MTPRPAQFSCLRSDGNRVVQVAVAGELDIATVPELDQVLSDAEARAPLVVLDLRALEFIDCSGANLMLAVDRRIRQAGGRFVVVRGAACVERLFALIGIDRQLELIDRPPSQLGAQTVSGTQHLYGSGAITATTS
jgi:anti-sigma B factor antagonist